MLPFIHNTNSITSSSINNISLTHFLKNNIQYPIQSSFNYHARIPSLLSNIFLWLIFLFTIVVLQINQYELNTIIRIIYSLIMLFIIISFYIFILIESNGCIEQILLKNCIQINIIKRELSLIEKNSKLNYYLTVTATNYYNSFKRKYIDYQIYDKSLCIRLQSLFYRNIYLIETPFNTRQYNINIPDFLIDKNHLCQLLFKFNLSIIGHDANIVYDDIKQEFQYLEIILLNSINKLIRIKRNIYFQFNDIKQQNLLLGQQHTCLVYENKMKIYYRWFLTENFFWIMTCIGLSWIFRAIFACLIRKIIVPIYIQLEGPMPLQSIMINNEKNEIKEKISDNI